MKKIFYSLLMLFSALCYISCESDPSDSTKYYDFETDTVHLDLWLTVQGTTTSGTYIARVSDPANSTQDPIDAYGKGAEVVDLSTYHVQKNGVYYSVNSDGSGLRSYDVTESKTNWMGTAVFGDNTYSTSSWSHQWIDDETLLMISRVAGSGTTYSSPTSNQCEYKWSKIDVSTMKLISEGTFDFESFMDADDLKYDETSTTTAGVEENFARFSTSGIVQYRPTDNKVVFFTSRYGFTGTVSAMTGSVNSSTDAAVVVVLDYDKMTVDGADIYKSTQGLSANAFGELLEEQISIDTNGDAYVIAYESETSQASHAYADYAASTILLRIPNGEYKFDADYEFHLENKGKMKILQQLKEGKGMVYVTDYTESQTAGMYGVSFNSYYAVVNYADKTLTPVQCNGFDLPWSSGSFANRLTNDGMFMYMGINSNMGLGSNEADGASDEYTQPEVYIYNLSTDEVSLGAQFVIKGFDVEEKYNFTRMHFISK